MLLKGRLYSLLIAMPLAMAIIALLLIPFGGSTLVVAVLLAGCGLIGTAAPVAWWTWLSKVLPEDAEAGGGLLVAVVQSAITVGCVGRWSAVRRPWPPGHLRPERRDPLRIRAPGLRDMAQRGPAPAACHKGPLRTSGIDGHAVWLDPSQTWSRLSGNRLSG